MDELWGKLTNLSYELFGVFVPGAILLLFVTLWWFALGAVTVQVDQVPSASLEFIQSVPSSFMLLCVTVALVYFLGHLLVWISRKSGPPEKRAILRVLKCLYFRIPRTKENFDEQLRPLMEASALKVGLTIDNDTWRRFYPLAKIILAERLTKSLVSIYQNKYTLHRSIAASSAILFWLTVLTICVGYFSSYSYDIHWNGIFALLIGSIVLIWGFSASADYYWKMWGNTIVTEVFAVLSGVTR